MPPRAPLLRLALRLLEALTLSALAGLFVWLVGLVFRLPFLGAAMLGFFCGGSATLSTLGVVIADRRARGALALVCALTGWAALQTLDYATFVHHQRRAQRAADYTAPPAEVDRRIEAELRELTGHGGPLGYLLAGWRARGVWMAALGTLELGVALAVAVRWAAGPGS